MTLVSRFGRPPPLSTHIFFWSRRRFLTPSPLLLRVSSTLSSSFNGGERRVVLALSPPANIGSSTPPFSLFLQRFHRFSLCDRSSPRIPFPARSHSDRTLLSLSSYSCFLSSCARSAFFFSEEAL